MKKDILYKEFLNRLKVAIKNEYFLEASWLAYTVIEDRLLSLLRNSGGVGKSKGKGKPIRMLGPKMKELKRRSKADDLLESCFEYEDLNKWKEDRNELTHAMADGSLHIEKIDLDAKSLAVKGEELALSYAAAARRLKKHRLKVKPPSL